MVGPSFQVHLNYWSCPKQSGCGLVINVTPYSTPVHIYTRKSQALTLNLNINNIVSYWN